MQFGFALLHTRMNTLLAIKSLDLLEPLATHLRRSGHEVVCTINTDDAANLIKTNLSLLIISWNIKCAGGARSIIATAREDKPKLPIVAVAGSFDQNDFGYLESISVVPFQTGNLGTFLPCIEKAKLLVTPTSWGLFWSVESLAEKLFMKFNPDEEGRINRERFCVEFTRRKKEFVETLARERNIPTHGIYDIPLGTRLEEGKARLQLIELDFWLECPK